MKKYPFAGSRQRLSIPAAVSILHAAGHHPRPGYGHTSAQARGWTHLALSEGEMGAWVHEAGCTVPEKVRVLRSVGLTPEDAAVISRTGGKKASIGARLSAGELSEVEAVMEAFAARRERGLSQAAMRQAYATLRGGSLAELAGDDAVKAAFTPGVVLAAKLLPTGIGEDGSREVVAIQNPDAPYDWVKLVEEPLRLLPRARRTMEEIHRELFDSMVSHLRGKQTASETGATAFAAPAARFRRYPGVVVRDEPTGPGNHEYQVEAVEDPDVPGRWLTHSPVLAAYALCQAEKTPWPESWPAPQPAPAGSPVAIPAPATGTLRDQLQAYRRLESGEGYLVPAADAEKWRALPGIVLDPVPAPDGRISVAAAQFPAAPHGWVKSPLRYQSAGTGSTPVPKPVREPNEEEVVQLSSIFGAMQDHLRGKQDFVATFAFQADDLEDVAHVVFHEKSEGVQRRVKAIENPDAPGEWLTENPVMGVYFFMRGPVREDMVKPAPARGPLLPSEFDAYIQATAGGPVMSQQELDRMGLPARPDASVYLTGQAGASAPEHVSPSV